jgi:uncharacterized protein YfdQ (DUF2303 family)
MTDTVGGGHADTEETPLVSVAAQYRDPSSGATWVHKDLVLAIKPWELEEHIAAPSGTERFGDVISWSQFVNLHAHEEREPYLTWNSRGLSAVLDYHSGLDNPGRAQWIAIHPFQHSRQWSAWSSNAGRWFSQAEFIEFIEDHMEDVLDPPAADLMGIVRTLKATINKSATVDIRSDGTQNAVWTDDRQVQQKGNSDATIPTSLKIAIPALKGHTDDQGKAIVYSLTANLRVSADDKDGKTRLRLRYTLPQAETSMEDAYNEVVSKARVLVGPGYSLLRAAD